MFGRVGQNRNDEMVENAGTARDEIEMTVSHRIEAAGVDRFDFIQFEDRSTAIVRTVPALAQSSP